MNEIQKSVQLSDPIDSTSLRVINEKLSPVTLPDEVIEIYQLANGADPLTPVFLGLNFLTLNSAYEAYQELISRSKENGIDWPKSLFPISDTDGQYILVALKDKTVYSLLIGQGDPLFYKESDNLNDFLQNCLDNNSECTETGIDLFNNKTWPDSWQS